MDRLFSPRLPNLTLIPVSRFFINISEHLTIISANFMPFMSLQKRELRRLSKQTKTTMFIEPLTPRTGILKGLN